MGVLGGVRGGDPLPKVGGGAHQANWDAGGDHQQVREAHPCAGFRFGVWGGGLLPEDSRPAVDCVEFDHLACAVVADALDFVADFDWLVAHVKESSGDFNPVKDLF